MTHPLVFCNRSSSALKYAADELMANGITVVDHPTPEVTHLLLDVPTRHIPEGLLDRLPEHIVIVGGKLDTPELTGYRTLDLLLDEEYLARNASITAECALRVASQRMETVFSNTPVLVIGWGRIGKCLCHLLHALNCSVTVAAREGSDRAILQALGFKTADPLHLTDLHQYRLIFNTAPSPILDRKQLTGFPQCIKIDLASSPGLDAEDVLWARGLPGVYAPESSGKLIAKTFLKRFKEGCA